MTLAKLITELHDMKAMADNLTATQVRCNELLEHYRNANAKANKMRLALTQVNDWLRKNPAGNTLFGNFDELKSLIDEALK